MSSPKRWAVNSGEPTGSYHVTDRIRIPARAQELIIGHPLVFAKRVPHAVF